MAQKKLANITKEYLSFHYIVRIVALALTYIIFAKLGLALAYSTEQVTTVWPPTGIALAALILMGYRYWPGVFIGAFTANLITHETIPVALGIASGNTLEALTGAYLLKRVINFDIGFTRIRDYVGLLLLSASASTLVSATIGTLSLAIGSIIAWNEFDSTWLVWWVGDMMGALIAAPLILVFAKNRLETLRKKPFEAILLFAFSAAVCILIFSQDSNTVNTLPYLVFPLIVWASLRFTQAGAVTVVPVIAAIAVWGTINDKGPFTRLSSIDHNLLLLDTFLLVISSTAMLTAITASQRRATESVLVRRSRQLQEVNRRITKLLAGAASGSRTKRNRFRSRSK